MEHLSENIEKKLVFRKFEDIKVSTKTFIAVTNVSLNIENVFRSLPITDYIIIPKKRGRRKNNTIVDPNKDIEEGSIISLEYRNELRGANLKGKDLNNKKRSKYFRNSVTIVMIVLGKKINFKVSRNGRFQITGCRSNKHAYTCVKNFWYYIKDNDTLYELDKQLLVESGEISNFKCIFIPAMRNIDFDLGFNVDRQKLDEFFNENTVYKSLLETSFGYTGVNIKLEIKKSIRELKLVGIEEDEKLNWNIVKDIPYSLYLKTLTEKERCKKLKKKRYNTFLVFHSGKVIMSGMEKTFMIEAYYKFLDIIRDCHKYIEEKLD